MTQKSAATWRWWDRGLPVSKRRGGWRPPGCRWRAAARPAAGAILAVACVLVIHAMEVGPAPLDTATAAGRLALDAAVLTIVYGLTWLITPAGRRDLAGVTELIRSLARAGPDTIEQQGL